MKENRMAQEGSMNTITRRALVVSGAALALDFAVQPAEAATGSVAIKIFSAGFLLGFAGGKGVLTFHGKSYRLSVGGVSAGALAGIAAAEFVGTAIHMRAPEDIEGVYSAISAGVAVAGGRGVVQLRNARGVELLLKGKKVGFMVSAALSGMEVKLK
jgi:hypothetical protein